MSSSMGLRVSILVACGLIFGLGCLKEYDFERPEQARGTLGQELFTIWKKDTARSATAPQARLALLEERGEDFVDAVDATIPLDHLGEFDTFLQDTLPLIDSGLMPGLTRKLTVSMEEAAASPGLLAAISGQRRPPAGSFITHRVNPDFAVHALSFGQMRALSLRTTDRVVKADGLHEDGRVFFEESTSVSDLLRAWKLSTDAPLASSAPSERWPMALSTLLFSEDARFERAAAGTPLFVARYDERGFPKAALSSTGIAFPFVDHDGDGLADVDQAGRFVLSDGSAASILAFSSGDLSEPVSRDAFGRATRGQSGFAFDYVDLNRTGLGFLVRSGARLANEEVLYHLLAAAPVVMGPLAVGEDARGSYVALAEDHPLLDVLDALVATLNVESLPEVLGAVAGFLDRASAQLAQLFWALQHASEAIDRHPAATLRDNQTLLYDLLPILRDIAQSPALWADFMEALRDPIIRRAGEAMLTLLKHKNVRAVPAVGGPYDTCFQPCLALPIGTDRRFDCIRACPNQEIFSVPMDFASAEAETNRSMMQRMFHLLRDTAGVSYTMNIVEARVPGITLPANLPPMVTLPGAAEAFIAAVAGNLNLADYISEEFTNSDLGQLVRLLDAILPFDLGNETVASALSIASGLFGVHLDTVPSPDQITRLFNQPDLRFESDDGSIVLAVSNPVCRDGFVMSHHHADGLYAGEASGLIDTIYPLARAFSNHGREDLLAQLFVVVHAHYSSRTDLYRTAQGSPTPMKGSNLVSFEPILIEVFEAGHFFDALYEFAHATKQIKAPGEIDFDEHMRRLVFQATRTDDGFKSRSGKSAVQVADGRNLSPISRLHIVLNGIEEAIERVPPGEPSRRHLDLALEGITNVLLEVEKADGEPAKFVEPGGLALTSRAIRQLSERAATLQERGELSTWLDQTLIDELASLWSSRGFYAMLRFGNELHAEAEMRALLSDFLQHIANSPAGYQQTTLALYTLFLHAVNTEFWTPFARFLATLLDPDRRWDAPPLSDLPLASHVALITREMLTYDAPGTILEVLHRGLRSEGQALSPLGVIVELVADYYRADPSLAGPLGEEDYRRVFSSIAGWLAHRVYGIEQYYKLAAQRRIHP
ncbi:MAG: hypothetical protein H0U74_12805 [Bradymonadaceae bacterium]|nr:hypothetical protein [Lujinxingiaceae bacterium]